MLWTRYLPNQQAAMPIILLAAMSALLLLSACQPKTPSHSASYRTKALASPGFHMAPAPQSAAQIQALMQQAKHGGDTKAIMQLLTTLMQDKSTPIRQEASFRHAQ